MTVWVNVTQKTGTKNIRREKRAGRDIIVVPSATLPNDIVMNGIKYPADAIAKGFSSLERSPAPLGHPMDDDRYISAKSPEGINKGWIGAWNENVRHKDGRVFIDKVIDVEVANRTADGKRLIELLNKGEPIHTSVGLTAKLDAAPENSGYSFIASELTFDHDAILIDEPGAGTPEQGVGIFVNHLGKSEQIEVINSYISDQADRELDYAVRSIVRVMEERAKLPLVERVKIALTEMFGIETKDTEPMTTPAPQPDISARIDALETKIGETIANAVATAVAAAVKPLTDAHATQLANAAAAEAAERADLSTKVIAANLLPEAAAAAAPIDTLRALVANIKAPETTTEAPKGRSGIPSNVSSFKVPKAG